MLLHAIVAFDGEDLAIVEVTIAARWVTTTWEGGAEQHARVTRPNNPRPNPQPGVGVEVWGDDRRSPLCREPLEMNMRSMRHKKHKEVDPLFW